MNILSGFLFSVLGADNEVFFFHDLAFASCTFCRGLMRLTDGNYQKKISGLDSTGRVGLGFNAANGQKVFLAMVLLSSWLRLRLSFICYPSHNEAALHPLCFSSRTMSPVSSSSLQQ